MAFWNREEKCCELTKQDLDSILERDLQLLESRIIERVTEMLKKDKEVPSVESSDHWMKDFRCILQPRSPSKNDKSDPNTYWVNTKNRMTYHALPSGEWRCLGRYVSGSEIAFFVKANTQKKFIKEENASIQQVVDFIASPIKKKAKKRTSRSRAKR